MGVGSGIPQRVLSAVAVAIEVLYLLVPVTFVLVRWRSMTLRTSTLATAQSDCARRHRYGLVEAAILEAVGFKSTSRWLVCGELALLGHWRVVWSLRQGTYCQIMGPYEMPLNDYNTVAMYPGR